MINETRGQDEFETPKVVQRGFDSTAQLPHEEVAILKEQIKTLEDRVLRNQAEMDNMRKRTLREREEAQKFAAASLVKDILKVSDNLDRAYQSLSVVTNGLAMVSQEVETLLGAQGVKAVSAGEGVLFDPHLHQAIGQVPSETVASGAIVGVSQAGYMMHDRLLRPAMVTVSQGPQSSQSQDQSV